ncbi:hypothetical protein PYCCODRAFT_1429715 [Trametes coccinea BRFM310]|uniref:Uncharacterized protein n=1 Tax=Trametes coccinea (strain BRFM310) TaxID=1353009 RepID=A0A1Y2J766_TRAC3|nr:hypothetical protein PYCCODRAFT_1429715 [Trametes coccinea BRFM310]
MFCDQRICLAKPLIRLLLRSLKGSSPQLEQATLYCALGTTQRFRTLERLVAFLYGGTLQISRVSIPRSPHIH